MEKKTVDITLLVIVSFLVSLFGSSSDAVLCEIALGTAAVIGAGITAAGGLGQGLLMNAKKRGTTRMLKVSKELADYNDQIALRNWNLQNAYNSPQAQIQRLREAGLNPALAYGEGSGANAAGAIDTASVNTDPRAYEDTRGEGWAKALEGLTSFYQTYQDIKARDASIEKDVATANAIELSKELTEAKVEAQKIRNAFEASANDYKLEGLELSNAQKAFDNEINNRFKADFMRQKLLESKARVQASEASTSYKKKQLGLIDKQIEQIDESIRASQDRSRFLQDSIRIGYGQLALSQRQQDFYEQANTRDYNRGVIEYQKDFGLRSKQLGLDYRKAVASTFLGMREQARKEKNDKYGRMMDWQGSMPKVSPLPFLKAF